MIKKEKFKLSKTPKPINPCWAREREEEPTQRRINGLEVGWWVFGGLGGEERRGRGDGEEKGGGGRDGRGGELISYEILPSG